MRATIRRFGSGLGILATPLPLSLKRPLARMLACGVRVLPGRPSSLCYLFSDGLLKRACQYSRYPINVRRHFPWGWMYLDISQKTQRALYLQKVYEPEVLRYIEKNLASGDTFVDVGANVGFYTLRAAALVGPRGKVFAFEPEPKNIAALRYNISLNGFSQIECFPLALSDEEGSKPFHRNPWNDGGGSLLPHDTFHDDGVRFTRGETLARFPSSVLEIPVEITTFDSFAASRTLPPPAIIKFDIEGVEYKALLGMEQFLSRNSPQLICEISQDGEKIGAFLERLGYRAFRLHVGNPKPLLRVPERIKSALFIKQ